MGDEPSNDVGWSGDVPVTPAPIEFVFGDVSHPVSHPGTSREPYVPAQKPAVSTPIRPWLVPLAATIGLIGAAIAVGALRDGPVDESNTDLSSESSTPITSVARTTAPTTDPPSPSTTAQPATTAPADDELAAAWRTEAIALPERVRSTSTPMRMFALASSGVLYDIDVQTGTMQSLDLDTAFYSSHLLVARDSVLILNNGSSANPMLVPDGGQPIEFPLGNPTGGTYIQGVAANGADYIGESWNSHDGTNSRVVLRADGTVDEVEHDDASWRATGGHDTGGELIVDAGGLYLESPDGTVRRVSEGIPVAVSSASVLARECDAQRQCAYVIIDLVNNDRVAATVPDEISFNDRQFWNPVLAPDGRTVLLSSNALSGVSALFVDLLAGTTTPVSVNIDDEYGPETGMWSPDSSGIFTTDRGGIVFVDAATGEATAVPLGGDGVIIVDVAVRPFT